MKRLIDADALRDKLQVEIDKGIPPFDDVMGSIRCGIRLARNIVEDEPTIDAEPVRHGKWIDRTIKVSAELTNIIHVCSVCEEMAVGKYRYCPHCGARMDKDDQVN
jgi:hypothetical protein